MRLSWGRNSVLGGALPSFVFALGCEPAEAPRPANAAASPAVAAAPSAATRSVAPRLEGTLIELHNPLGVARAAETISVRLSEVMKLLPSLQLAKVVVQRENGVNVPSQLVDTDGDERADELVFQSDLGPNESRTFVLGEGAPSPPSRAQFKVYGRFVRERHDDFAWENDRVAHRMYGPALETWAAEPLTSSGVDIWVKRTPRLVVNDWYQSDDYHHDNGDGGDFYSVGPSRGCGGIGIWDGKQLYVSHNFVRSRVLANGPIRLIFELEYAPWQLSGQAQISETKRVTADAGQHFDRFQSYFQITGKPSRVSLAVGIAKHAGAAFDGNLAAGVLRSWEPFNGDNGQVGCAVISVSSRATGFAETPLDRLLLMELPNAAPVTYLAGTGWSKGGDSPGSAAWSALVQRTENLAHSPVSVSLSAHGSAARGAALSWPERAAAGLIEQNPNGLTDQWEYDSGLVLDGLLKLWQKTHDDQYFDYVKRTIDRLIDQSGNITGYRLEDYNLDAINMGKVLFPLLRAAKNEQDRARYRQALTRLREQLKRQPRTLGGGFWHKQKYLHQMWLDGVYMASPFLAEYAREFGEPAAADDAAQQILLAEQHLRDPKTGLLYHGWDEAHEQRWANPKTGTSAQFWGRSVGWYAMAVVDVLELLPEGHPKRAALRAVLSRLCRAIVNAQDKPSGVWWQILDAPGREKNYREASASAMFVYALAKAARLGLVERAEVEPAIERGARGLIEQFASFDERGQLHLKNTCKVAGLGGDPYRDGSYAYYTSTEISDRDPKGIGAFILASLELP